MVQSDLSGNPNQFLDNAFKVLFRCLHYSILLLKPCYESSAPLSPFAFLLFTFSFFFPFSFIAICFCLLYCNSICPKIWDLFFECCKSHSEKSDIICGEFWKMVRSGVVALVLVTHKKSSALNNFAEVCYFFEVKYLLFSWHCFYFILLFYSLFVLFYSL